VTDASIQTLLDLDPSHRPDPSTSLSCFIHIIRLRKIESHIQQSIYRVDKHKILSRSKIDYFLSILEEWRSTSPPPFAESDTEVYSYDGIYYFEVYYYKCLRLLLYPHLSSPIVNPDIVVRCADACGGVCRSYKALHRETSVGFSLMAIYAIFLSGLTLLYCLWMSPSTIYSTTTMNDLNACSVLLYVIAERWPEAKRYRDAFETIKQNVLTTLEQGANANQRVPLPGLANPRLQDLGGQGFHPGEAQEYSKMMGDMVNPARHHQYQMAMPPPPPTATPRPRAMSDQSSIRVSSQMQHGSRGPRIAQSLSHPTFETQSPQFSTTPAYGLQTMYTTTPSVTHMAGGSSVLPSFYSFADARTSSITSLHYPPDSDSLAVTHEEGVDSELPLEDYLESGSSFSK
jgi:hypothetical protein